MLKGGRAQRSLCLRELVDRLRPFEISLCCCSFESSSVLLHAERVVRQISLRKGLRQGLEILGRPDLGPRLVRLLKRILNEKRSDHRRIRAGEKAADLLSSAHPKVHSTLCTEASEAASGLLLKGLLRLRDFVWC